MSHFPSSHSSRFAIFPLGGTFPATNTILRVLYEARPLGPTLTTQTKSMDSPDETRTFDKGNAEKVNSRKLIYRILNNIPACEPGTRLRTVIVTRPRPQHLVVLNKVARICKLSSNIL
jgi:hypothetical protein